MLANKRLWFTLFTALTAASFGADNKKMADSGANLLEQTSLAFTHIAKKAMPATVFIKAQMSAPELQQPQQPDPFQDDFFRRFFGQAPGSPYGQQNPQPQISSGSGFLIREDGYIVTNFHVVKDTNQITVILNDGREYPATLKGSDPRTDLALLKIEEKGLPSLKFGDSDELQIGEWVVAIGNPFGFDASLSVGVVSAKGRQDLGIASYEDFIQTDAAINPGNSGGPLLNLQCEVIGVNTAIFTRSGGYQGIGFSIPSKMAGNVIDQILNGGTVQRAFLGIILQPVDKELCDALNLDKQEGVLISEIVKDSPAQKAGLLQGDIILAYNDKPAKSVAKFRNDIALMNPGTDLKLKILRNNKPLTFTVKLGSQAENEVITAEVFSKIGLEVDNLNPELASKLGYSSELEGVVITKVKPGSSAAQAGLRPGFLITGVAVNWNNQRKVKNLAEFDEAFKELGDKKHIILIVRQQNFQRYYTLKIN
jgi:serine protease Do